MPGINSTESLFLQGKAQFPSVTSRAIHPVKSVAPLPLTDAEFAALYTPSAVEASRKKTVKPHHGVKNRLVDRFGRPHTYLRISVTDRCNLRCTYCMPSAGITWRTKHELLSYDEILRIAHVFSRMGIQKIRITGGEPLVRPDLPALCNALNQLENIHTIAMTTNGLLLKNHAAALQKAGLTALNISIDTLKKERFIDIAKRDGFDAAMAGIEAALMHGFTPLKLNVVVMKGVNDDEILDFVDFIREQPINLRFIEYMPFRDNAWSENDIISYQTMRNLIETRYQLRPLLSEIGAVGKDFELVNYQGAVSFISSMTDSFCGSCNRLRLTADGQIKSCLFHPAEVNIRDVLRQGVSDAELESCITEAVLQKQEAHPPLEELINVENRAMIEIGG